MNAKEDEHIGITAESPDGSPDGHLDPDQEQSRGQEAENRHEGSLAQRPGRNLLDGLQDLHKHSERGHDQGGDRHVVVPFAPSDHPLLDGGDQPRADPPDQAEQTDGLDPGEGPSDQAG